MELAEGGGRVSVKYGDEKALQAAITAANDEIADLDSRIEFVSLLPLLSPLLCHRLHCFLDRALEREVKERLDDIHMYNDVKDAAQALMGKYGLLL